MNLSLPPCSKQAYWMSPFLIGSYFLLLLPFWKPANSNITLKCAICLYFWEIFLLLCLPIGVHLSKKGDWIYLFTIIIGGGAFFLYAILPESIFKIFWIQMSLIGFGLSLVYMVKIFSFFFSPCFSQIAGQFLGFFFLSLPLSYNFILPLVANQTVSIQWLLLIHPVPSGIYDLSGWDLFRFSWMYDFSPISDFPYTYPSVKVNTLEIFKVFFLIFCTYELLTFGKRKILKKRSLTSEK